MTKKILINLPYRLIKTLKNKHKNVNVYIQMNESLVKVHVFVLLKMKLFHLRLLMKCVVGRLLLAAVEHTNGQQ